MADIKYMKLKTYSPNMAALHGKPKTKVDKIIQLRSADVHNEIQFTDRYGEISFSATMADDCKCARFKKIAYSHEERWKTVLIPVTAEQEALMFKEACVLADVNNDFLDRRKIMRSCISKDELFYGPDAVKYDLAGVSFGFISHRKIWKPSATKMWCSETCFIVLLKVFPDILTFKIFRPITGWEDLDTTIIKLEPHDLQPTQGDEIARNYFK